MSKFLNYKLFAILPQLELLDEVEFSLGPLLFVTNKNQPATTVQIFRQKSTKIQVARQALYEGLCALFFCNYCQNFLQVDDIPNFEEFSKIVFLSQKNEKLASLCLNLIQRQKDRKKFLVKIDHEIYLCLSKLFSKVYGLDNRDGVALKLRAFINSLRYFCQIFRFRGPLHDREKILILYRSFICLLDVSPTSELPDLKHKLRKMLHLKYYKPLEIFWHWIDSFYELKCALIQEKGQIDLKYRGNPNFIIPHLDLGLKFFTYAFYFTLASESFLGLKNSKINEMQTLLQNFKQKDLEILLWTDFSLLSKIEIFLNRVIQDPSSEDLQSEICYLLNLYLKMQELFETSRKYTCKAVYLPDSSSQTKQLQSNIILLLKANPLPNLRLEKKLDSKFGLQDLLKSLQKRLEK